MTTIKVNSVQCEGGYNTSSDRTLHLRINDPASGSPLIDLELDAHQVLNLLSGLQDTYEGGKLEIYSKGISRIGRPHVVVSYTMTLPYFKDVSRKPDAADWNKLISLFEDTLSEVAPAWEISGGPMERENHHNRSINHDAKTVSYTYAMHVYVPAGTTEESFLMVLNDARERGGQRLLNNITVTRLYSGAWNRG